MKDMRRKSQSEEEQKEKNNETYGENLSKYLLKLIIPLFLDSMRK